MAVIIFAVGCSLVFYVQSVPAVYLLANFQRCIAALKAGFFFRFDSLPVLGWAGYLFSVQLWPMLYRVAEN